MKRLYMFILGVAVAAMCCTMSAQSIKQTFLSMPDTLCPFFSPQQRLQLLRLYDAQAPDSLVNLFGTKSKITFLTEQQLTMSITNDVEYQLLQKADTTYFIQTVCAPICSSVVKAYIANWMYVGRVNAPFNDAVFPKAEIKDGELQWTDCTPTDNLGFK